MCVCLCQMDVRTSVVPNFVAEERNVSNNRWVGSLQCKMIDWQLRRVFMERWEERLM